MNILDLPFNKHVGFALTPHDDDEVVCLDPEPHHLNHVGTIHAGAIYSLAEAESGHLLINALQLDPSQVIALLRSAEVKYRKPASGRILAIGSFIDSEPELLSKQQKRSIVGIRVRIITESNTEVFVGEFSWFLSRVRNL